jgi:hypothetical protein
MSTTGGRGPANNLIFVGLGAARISNAGYAESCNRSDVALEKYSPSPTDKAFIGRHWRPQPCTRNFQ